MSTGGSPLAGGPSLINAPIVDPKTGTPNFQFVKWFQDASQRLQNGLNQLGQLIGIISAETKISGRAGTIGTALQNLSGAGELTGSAIVGKIPAAVLPAPTIGAFGGVRASGSAPGQFVASIDATGTPQLAQPTFDDIGGKVAPSQLPAPTVATLGGVKAKAPAGSQWLNAIDVTGTPQSAQPAFSDISGQLVEAQLPAAGLSVTITTAALTGTGAQGSMTFTNGILTAETPAT